MTDHARMVVQDLEVELAPDQFRQPDCRAAGLAFMRQSRQTADRHGAEAQVHRQVGRALHGRKISCAIVVVDALLEIAEQFFRPALTGTHRHVEQIGFLEAERRE
jgi:hypothetical protein